jgi:acetyl-CoA acetyltransferase
MSLTVDAITAAVADAGLPLSAIDGLTTYPGDVIGHPPGYAGPELSDVQDVFRFDLTWHSGESAMSPNLYVFGAVMGVACGLARHVVIYRTVTEASAQQGRGRQAMADGTSAGGPFQYLMPAGAVSPAHWVALFAQRYMWKYGVTKEQLGWVPVVQRRHAALNPDAIYRHPFTIEDYLASRPITSPLSLFDCDVPVDASTAVVISSADAVGELRAPVQIEALSGGILGKQPSWDRWHDMSTMASHETGAALWRRTDLRPADVDVAQLYDGFSPLVLFWLEGLGFCGPGEGGQFVEGGERISLGGELPINTWGGQLSGGRLHAGFGHIVEAVRQVRGEAGARQVPRAQVAVTCAGGGPGSGAMLLVCPDGGAQP